MKKYFSILNNVSLFNGIDSASLETMLNCLGSEIKNMSRNEVILLAGDTPKHVGIVLAGQLHIIREDYDGNRSLIAALMPGEIFAEALCCAGVEESPVTVLANADSTVMLLPFSRILRVCPHSCSFHARLIENMLGLIAKKNFQLQSRMEIVSMKSVRAKIIRYLQSFTPQRGQEFTIPLNRGEMADFLCVERSALSHELARMKQEGLLAYRKDTFISYLGDGE